MIKPIKILLTTAGASTDTFSLFSDADGFVTPFATGITKAQLLAGYISSVAPDLTSVVRVKSNSACMNSIDLDLIRKLILSTTSTSATWSPQQVTNSGATLTWDVTGDITPTSQTIDDPTFDLSANTGTVNMDVYDVSNLSHLYRHTGELTSLNVNGCVNLYLLECSINQLTSLDLSNNISLFSCSCLTNQLTSLDVSANTALTILNCYDNLFTPSATDQVYIDLDTNGVSNGTLRIKNNRTSASDTARANLITKGWTIVDTYTT